MLSAFVIDENKGQTIKEAKSMRIGTIVLALTAFTMSQSALLADPIDMEIGTFLMGAPQSCGGHSWCSSTASDEMGRNGLKVTKSGGVTFGATQDVVVAVVCTDQGNQSLAFISAASSKTGLAEKTRNTVRTAMTRAGCL